MLITDYSFLLYILEQVKAASYDAEVFYSIQSPSNSEKEAKIHGACLQLQDDNLIRLVGEKEKPTETIYSWRANV